jgi:hypothetical protein
MNVILIITVSQQIIKKSQPQRNDNENGLGLGCKFFRDKTHLVKGKGGVRGSLSV